MKERKERKKTDTDFFLKRMLEWHSWRGNESAAENVGGRF